MAKKFAPEQTLHLVNLYREHECLWNIHYDNYKNPHFKNRALQKMCTDLNIKDFTVNDLKKKIKIIRSTYCIELDKIEKSIGTEFVYKPRVIWFEALNSFLRDVTIRKKRVTDSERAEYNIQKEENSENEQLDEKYSDDDADEEIKYEEQDPLAKAAYEIILSEPSSSIPEQKKRKIYQLDSATNTVRLVRDDDDDIEAVTKVEGKKLRKIAKKSFSEKCPLVPKDHTYHAEVNSTQATDGVDVKIRPDEFDTFGKHVANQLRKLSPLKCIFAQEEIQSTITKFLMADMTADMCGS